MDPLTQASNSRIHESIPGWGMDADPENDPAYPMKRRTGADHEGMNYEKAPQQQSNVEIFHSIERPGVTRVFGTSTPPAGLSGLIRSYAFKYSEATAAHWMTLILADRVDVVQGLINDLKNGVVPNIFAELGWAAEWKYNRSKFLGKLALQIAIASFLITAMSPKRRSR
jgi:hypothetical protein